MCILLAFPVAWACLLYIQYALHVLGFRQACCPSPNLCFTISFSSSTELQLLLLLDVY